MSTEYRHIIGLIFLTSLVVIVISQQKECKTSAECGQNECCVEEDRRARRFILGPSRGFCRARRYQGQACHVYVHHAFGNPDMYMNYCPCDVGLACHGTTVDGNIHHNPFCVPDGTSTQQTISASKVTVPDSTQP